MNSKKSKKLLAKARSFKRVKRGDMIAEVGYKALKEDELAKKKTQVVKPKISPRQKRLLKQRDDLTTLQLRGRARAKERQQAPKKKAHKF